MRSKKNLDQEIGIWNSELDFGIIPNSKFQIPPIQNQYNLFNTRKSYFNFTVKCKATLKQL